MMYLTDNVHHILMYNMHWPDHFNKQANFLHYLSQPKILSMKTCYFNHLWKRLIAYNPVLSDNEYQNSNADGVFNERFLNKSKIKMQMLCISQNNIFIDFTLVELKTWSESNLQKNGKLSATYKLWKVQGMK